MVEIAVVADFGDLCGECPVWNSDGSILEWTDSVGGKLLRLPWPSGQPTIAKSGVSFNGFRRNRQGGYVITNNEGIWLWDGENALCPVVNEVEGRPCQTNDCVADASGRLVTATYYYDPVGEYALGKLISVSTDGKARILDEGFHLSNGLGFSPDHRTLYFADSVARRIYRYSYDPARGSVGERRVFVEVPREEGIPDGLSVDAEGYVWSAQWYGSCIVRYDPEGRLERRVSIPAKQTSSLTFGGPELTDIFVTSAAQSEPMPVMPPGYDAKMGNFGGALYHLNLGIPGQPQHLADLQLRAQHD